MKFRIVLLGVFIALALPAQTLIANQPNTGHKQPVSTGQQTVTGCVDEQGEYYVMREAQSSQLVSLQGPGTDDDSYFARFLGHEVRVTGVKSSETMKVTRIEQVSDMCKAAK